MDERILKWLYDVDLAISEIDSFFENQPKDFIEYKKNLMLKRGEAVNRIIKRDSSFENIIDDARNIIGMRNQVIHAYDNISDENVWAILINHLPALKNSVKGLISNY